MDYLTNDTELTAVADAIREKSETTDLLEWPDGFIQAIEDCETGGVELDWLWHNQITDILSGEIDTADDAYAAPPLALTVEGASTQESTTGKNIVEWASDSYTNTSGNTQNAMSYCLGSLSAKWTCPSSLIGQTIVLSMDDGGSGYVPYIRLYDSNGALLTTYSTGVRSGTRIYTVGTVPEGTATIGFGGTLTSGKTVKQPMVEVGTTMTTYEPYTGGKPSPNPDYPQDILSVEPRNILPSTVYQLAENITVVANSAYRSMYCEVDPNTTYTVSRARVLGNRFGVYTTTVEPAAGVALTTIKRPDTETGALTYTFTTPADASYAFFYLSNNGADVSDSEMQLENGSVAHPYLPYGCSLGLVLAGKNLWADLSPGYININGGVTSPSSTMLEYVTDYIPATYGDVIRIVNLMPTDAAPWIGIGTYDSSKTFIIRYGRTNRNWDWTIPEANTAYIRISMRTYGYHSHIVATQNETPTTIPLYDGTLRSLPDGTKDELHLSYLKPSNREGWSWYSREVTRNVYELTVNPNWSFTQTAVGTTGDRFNLVRGELWPAVLTNVGLFDRFQYSVSNSMPWGYASVRITNWLVFNNGDQHFGSVVDFKAWLTDNPTTMLYPLATPIVTELDPIELPIMPSENATVWCDGGSAQPTFTMEYIQNANIVISRLEDTIADLATS